MNEQDKKVPTLRFKGFTNDWEQHKLRDVADLNGRIGFRGYTRKDIVNKDKGILAFSPTNIVSNRLIKTSKDTYITEKKYDESPEIKLKNGYVLFVKTGSTLGKSALIKELSQLATVNPQIVVIKPKRINASFMSIILLNDKVQRQVFSRKIGGAVPTLTENEINNFNFNVPKTTEQQSISEIIECLNNFLSLQQRKLDLLKQLKKGFLQKMFADKDSKQPILRFKGFHDDWEQRRLGEVAEIKTGSRNHQDSVDNGKYPFFIRSEKVERLNEYDFDTKAILVPGDGRIGEIFHYYDGKFALHQRVYKVDNFKEVNPLYLLNLFKYKFKKHALRLNAQGTVPSLRLPMFTNWNILIPNLNEQQKIGLFFQQLDSLITLQQRKQNHLKLLKKSLLQQMFI